MEEQGSKLKIEVEKFLDFKNKLAEIKKAELQIKNLNQLHFIENEFKIDSKQAFDDLLSSRTKFMSMNVASEAFNFFEKHLSPFIFWLNKSVKLLK